MASQFFLSDAAPEPEFPNRPENVRFGVRSRLRCSIDGPAGATFEVNSRCDAHKWRKLATWQVNDRQNIAKTPGKSTSLGSRTTTTIQLRALPINTRMAGKTKGFRTFFATELGCMGKAAQVFAGVKVTLVDTLAVDPERVTRQARLKRDLGMD